MNYNKQSYVVQHYDGTQIVSGIVIGFLGVRKNIGEWVVDHLPTGRHVASFRKQNSALRFATLAVDKWPQMKLSRGGKRPPKYVDDIKRLVQEIQRKELHAVTG